MYIQNSVRCKRFPHLFNGFESIGVEQLSHALLANERRRQGCLPRGKSVDDTAGRFLKTVDIASRAVWGSNGERSQCRQKAFAYQARFGQPALFVTLTPNTDNSFAMAQYTGISSVGSLFDVLEARMTSKAELREATLGNDCASARLFMRQIDAFISCVLGFNPKNQKPSHQSGLFGKVEAYFGMVETQGRGTLHVHFLIWLLDSPPNSAAVDAMLASANAELFCKDVVDYANSIVSNKLPLNLSECRCSGCGASSSYLVPLPIPDMTRKDPKAGLYSAQAKQNVTEPLLLQCSICKIKCSSQHLMRCALLQHRPVHWPDWRHSNSKHDITTQASRELKFRNSLHEATHIVEHREEMESSLSSYRNGLDSTKVEITEWLEHLNSPQMKLLKSDNDPFQNDDLTRLIEMLPPAASDARMPQKALDYMVSTLVLLLNQHWWGHTNTCFKPSCMTADSSFCRYGFPKERQPDTTFTARGVQLGRPVGHEFVNGFNHVIMSTFKCNHDIQVLLGGHEATHRIHYCCKYVTKHQRRLDSVVAIALGAFKRRQERELLAGMTLAPDADNRLAVSRKRVASIVYSMTNRQEVAGPLAALYLYRGSCCYSSSICTTLPLGDIVRQLCTTEEYSCRLIRECNAFGGLNFRPVSSLDDYIYRHDTLASFNLYEFSMKFFRKKDQNGSDAKFGFLSGHPLHRTHSLGQRYHEVVPIIQGYRLPYVDSESSVELQSKRAILALTLFKAFRSVGDLIGDESICEAAWIHAYEQWKHTRTDFVKLIMSNMDDYYTGLNYANEHRAEAQNPAQQTSDREATVQDEGLDDEDDLYSVDDTLDFEYGDEGGDDGGDNTDDIYNIWGLCQDSSRIVESSSLHPSVCPSTVLPDSRIKDIIGAFKRFGMVESAAVKTAVAATSASVEVQTGFPQKIAAWVRDVATDNKLIIPNPERSDIRDTEMTELFEDVLNEANTHWDRASKVRSQSPTPVKQFASITAVSKAFTLNQKQHLALKVIGVALLIRWRKSDSMAYIDGNTAEIFREDQLRFFLGGEGGTGKSRVIDAVQKLCVSWGRGSCLVKTALTGKAATLIEGRTLESFLMQIDGEKAVETAMELDLLIIDEVSMMKKSQLVELDRKLRIIKRLPNVPFGGIHVVFVGDFLQLPPVGADPIYRDPSSRPKCTATDFTAFQLWRSFERVIVLDESVRFRDDPAWGCGCHEARLGIWREEFVSLINSRMVSKHSDSIKEWISSADKTTFVTPDNSTRLSINNLFVSTAAKLLPDNVYPVRILANFKGKLKDLSRAEVAMVMGLPDSKLGRMAPYLDLLEGMPIQVTQNVRPQKMVANGTLGTLESISYAPGTTFRIIHDTVADMLVKVPSRPPIAVIVRLPRGDTASPMLGSSDSDLFPLLARSAYKQSEIRLPGPQRSCARVLAVRVQQFPLVCAVASTIYKVQGETLSRMVVTEWKSNAAAANKPEQPYLLVSRVTSRYAFLTLSPFTPELVRWAHPPAYALEEEARLLRLSESTIEQPIVITTPTQV